MVKARVRNYYRQLRHAGYRAGESLRSAKIVDRFNRAERAGLVRISLIPDDSEYDPGDTDGMTAKQVTDMWDRINRLGVYGVVGEYRLNEDSEWESADSVWGCAGYDHADSFIENCYVPDIMAETLDTLKNTLRARCECCRK